MVSGWSLRKHSLESWEQIAFALRKEAAAKQNKKISQQLNKSPAVAGKTTAPPHLAE